MRVYLQFADLQLYLKEVLVKVPNYEGTLEFYGNPYWFGIFGIAVRRYEWSDELFFDEKGNAIVLAAYRVYVTKTHLERWIAI